VSFALQNHLLQFSSIQLKNYTLNKLGFWFSKLLKSKIWLFVHFILSLLIWFW